MGNILRTTLLLGVLTGILLLYGRLSGGRTGLDIALPKATLAPIAALLVRAAISRSREYLPDKTWARLARTAYPPAPALEMPAGAGLFELFSTHPPAEKRITRLRLMARGFHG